MITVELLSGPFVKGIIKIKNVRKLPQLQDSNCNKLYASVATNCTINHSYLIFTQLGKEIGRRCYKRLIFTLKVTIPLLC